MKKRHGRYLEILRQMNEPLGDLQKGETQVVSNPEEMLQIEADLQQYYLSKGQPKECGNLGVVFENPWYAIANEPVRFLGKDGSIIAGSYLRVLFKGDLEGQSSVFCLPMLDDSADFLLTMSYRTTVRGWVIEAPGTVTRSGESHEDALHRCVRDKLGHKLLEAKPLSSTGVISERGIMGAAVPVYLVMVSEDQCSKPVDLNVHKAVRVSLQELRQGFIDGFIMIDGKKCLCQDSYTAYALLLMSFKK